jgi:hypothetical protein
VYLVQFYGGIRPEREGKEGEERKEEEKKKRIPTFGFQIPSFGFLTPFRFMLADDVKVVSFQTSPRPPKGGGGTVSWH